MSAITFLGLMERAGKLEIGEGSCGTAVRAGKAKLLLTASDASPSLLTKARRLAGGYRIPLICLPFTKEQLGDALGLGLAGMLASTDTGMAAAFASKLEAQFPGLCQEELASLHHAADRAAQRRREESRHRRNRRKKTSGGGRKNV